LTALRRLAVALAVLLIAGCGSTSPPPSIAVGAGPDAESTLLAHVYAAALRSYGSPSHVEQSPDPLGDLDTGRVEVVPGLTGRLLQRFDPGATARGGEQVYRSMISALPEGIGAGDYAQSAEDKPALAVTTATAKAWDGRDVGALVDHCRGVSVGAVAGDRTPTAVAVCRLPVPVEFPDAATLFAALRSGRVGAAWTSTAATGVPDDVVVLGDRTSTIRAQNVVPLYRRNELSERQVLALNEIAGELDTGSLADMLSKFVAGTDPGAVADEWLAAHPLGK
jgi:osmoprotectant transport system substrate-binding protein